MSGTTILIIAVLVAAPLAVALRDAWALERKKGRPESPDAAVTELLTEIAELDRPFAWLWRGRRLGEATERLVDAYEDSDEATRAAIRSFMKWRNGLSLRLLRLAGATARRSKEADLEAMEEDIRRALLILAIRHEHGDYRDELMLLQPVFARGTEAGLDVDGIFRQVEEGSDDKFARFLSECRSRFG